MTATKKSNLIAALLFSALLLMGFGHLLTLPAFEGLDETAHYSRLEGQAFCPNNDKQIYLLKDVAEYPHRAPMKQSWIYLQAFNALNQKGKDTANKEAMAHEIKQQGYTDYRSFFMQPDHRISDYLTAYRNEPASTACDYAEWKNRQFQHPPLYYMLFGTIMRHLSDASLVTRFLVLRGLGFFLAFCGLVIGFSATQKHLTLKGYAYNPVLLAAGIFYPFIMPVFFDDFGRLGNDCLCLFLFSLIWAVMLWHLRQPSDKMICVLLGIVMGFSWLTKAFMIPVSIGCLIFMALQSAKDDGKSAKLANTPSALLTLLTASLVGLWCYVGDGLTGSAEINGWLHGKNLAPQYSIETLYYIGDNLLTLLSTVFYPLPALGMSLAGNLFVLALYALLLSGFIAALPKDWRREEWLPVYAGFFFAGGLFIHAIFAAIEYRVAGVTPGYYIHVLAPALMLCFTLCLSSAKRISRRLLSVLIAAAPLITVSIELDRIWESSGCAWLGNNRTNYAFTDSCSLNSIFKHMEILTWPAAGFACIFTGLVVLLIGARLIIQEMRQLDKIDNLRTP